MCHKHRSRTETTSDSEINERDGMGKVCQNITDILLRRLRLLLLCKIYLFLIIICLLKLLRWIYTPNATAMRRAMPLLRWRNDTIAKSLLFCRVATIVFSSGCLVILITFFYDFRWQLLSDGSDIAKKLKVDNFNSAATACDDPCDEIFR